MKRLKNATLGLALALVVQGCAQSNASQGNVVVATETVVTPQLINTESKMKVEIWSDIMCPFCYIGKRHFEQALQQFAESNNLEIEWKSFQLDPSIPKPYTEGKSMYEYLAERKGFSLEQSKQMHANVVQMAARAGLQYDFDKAVVANSWDAHRVIQLAKSKGLGDAIEERFFEAYFTEGKDMADHTTLIQLAKEVGIEEARVKEVLASNEFEKEVKLDIQRAQQVGVTGVPFFVFNDKYAVSGAQPSNVFLETLQKSFGEWSKENPTKKLEVINGAVCTPEGECK
jgi:predicted DsbA family dithiol-disulfide isomerase